jgi:dihydroorotase
MDLVRRGAFSLETAVQRACHAPAILFGVENRGFIREGYWADLVVVDPAKPQPATKAGLQYQCGWSPFEGHTFGSSIDRTFVNGVCVYENGRVSAPTRRRA